MGTILEKDLYQPIKTYLEEQGYKVHSEVKNCDITATKNSELIIIEMKKNLNLTLLVQASNRQKTNASVYIAILKPIGGIYSKKWRKYLHLVKRLELGLILVTINNKKVATVRIIFHPIEYKRKTNYKMKKSIINEINGRSADYNEGGVSKTKLVTAYRENAIYIACALKKNGDSTPKQLRTMGTGDKTTSILYNNHYGWFKRIDKGVYRLATKGGLEMANFPKIVIYYKNKLSSKHNSN